MKENNIESDIEKQSNELTIVSEEKNNSNSPKSNQENKKVRHQSALSTTQVFNNDDVSMINPKKNQFPFCIVWTPIPFISHIFPFIGHLSIGNSEGFIHDFCSSHFVSVNMNTYGQPIIYCKLEIPSKDSIEWNNCIKHADLMFQRKEYNLCGTNCISYCGYVLSFYNYKGRNTYSNMDVWRMVWKNGVYVSKLQRVKNYFFLIFIALFLIVIIIIFSTK